MTVPPERDDRSALDLLGLSGASDLAPVDAPSGGAPLTRRELRELERQAEAQASPRAGGRRSAAGVAASVAPRSAPARPAPRAPKKTLGARLLSAGAMVFAAALAVGMSLPASALNRVTPEEQVMLLAEPEVETQTARADASFVEDTARDDWDVTSWAQMLKQQYGDRSFDYTVGTGPIRWPFPAPVTISSGFGDRAAPCRGCSTQHSGLDFNPGWGAAIFAIADGVVYDQQEYGGSWGSFVIIEHQIDGQTVYSGYAHMQRNSSPLRIGDEVKVGDFVGLVGATGQATGAHLHFTISIGEPQNFVDPFQFLKRYAS